MQLFYVCKSDFADIVNFPGIFPAHLNVYTFHMYNITGIWLWRLASVWLGEGVVSGSNQRSEWFHSDSVFGHTDSLYSRVFSLWVMPCASSDTVAVVSWLRGFLGYPTMFIRVTYHLTYHQRPLCMIFLPRAQMPACDSCTRSHMESAMSEVLYWVSKLVQCVTYDPSLYY